MKPFHLILILGLLQNLLGLGCTKILVAPMKEKQTLLAEGRAGIATDHFLYERASGPVDIVFVVDNTDASTGTWAAGYRTIPVLSYVASDGTPGQYNILTWFKEHYETLYILMENSPLLNYRTQLITASQSSPRWPLHYLQSSLGDVNKQQHNKLHLDEAMKGMGRNVNYPTFLFGEQQNDALDPYAASLSALSSQPFTDSERSSASLFLVYFLGQDSVEKNIDLIIQQMNSSNRKKFLTHVFIVSNDSHHFQMGCNYEHPTHFLNLLEKFAPQMFNLERINLCNLSPEQGNFSQYLYSKILASRGDRQSDGSAPIFTLSQVPYHPEWMTVQAGGHTRLRYGIDYTLNEITNSIQIDNSISLNAGDPIYINYFTQPAQGTIPGLPPSLGIPTSGSP